MTVPVLASLLIQHPGLRITVLTRKFFAPMFSSLENITLHEADFNGRHKGLRGLWRLFGELKNLKPDMVADLHNVLRTNILKWFFFFTGIPFVQIHKGRTEKKALTRVRNKLFRPLKTTHRRYADVFEKMGYPVNLGKPVLQARKPLSSNTVERIGLHQTTWIGIAPFAAYKGKMYPLDQMKAVIKSLSNTNKYKIILFGGGKPEETALEAIGREFENVVSTAVVLGFEEQLALISHLDLMLSMDSSNGHLAAIFGVPTITLWGVTHPYAGFSPYGQDVDNALLVDRKSFPLIPTSVYGNKFPEGYENAIATIPPETVIRKIEEVLAKSGGNRQNGDFHNPLNKV
jgi:ADP-heptose:LPS heptosyltransferase